MTAISYRELNVPERRCLALLYMPEPLSNLPGVGQGTIDRLLRLGLIEETEAPLGSDERYYCRTPAGKAVVGEMRNDNAIPR